jgi:SET domain
MKPWTLRNQTTTAFHNKHVRLGKRESRAGTLRGVYACRPFEKGDYVASYHGYAISPADLFEIGHQDRALFDHISEYGVMTPSGHHLYPTPGHLNELGAHLINHSCSPNAQWDKMERGAILVRATRPVAAGEEIVIHYGWIGIRSALEGRRNACVCLAPYCAGAIELKIDHVRQDDRVGFRLSQEEATNRFLADIINDTQAHERTLYDYADRATGMLAGKIHKGVNQTAFFERLQAAAMRALQKAEELKLPLSSRRIAQIAQLYSPAGFAKNASRRRQRPQNSADFLLDVE